MYVSKRVLCDSISHQCVFVGICESTPLSKLFLTLCVENRHFGSKNTWRRCWMKYEKLIYHGVHGGQDFIQKLKIHKWNQILKIFQQKIIFDNFHPTFGSRVWEISFVGFLTIFQVFNYLTSVRFCHCIHNYLSYDKSGPRFRNARSRSIDWWVLDLPTTYSDFCTYSQSVPVILTKRVSKQWMNKYWEILVFF